MNDSKMQVPLLDLKAQYATYKNEAIQAITDVCESQMLCLGPAVAEFEEKIAAYCGSKYAVGVSSGSDALLVSLIVLDIKPGDEVITTPKRDHLQKFFAENQINSAIFYPKPLHLQDCFSELGYKQGDLPVAERLCGEVLSLPVCPELTAEQIEYVAETILKFYGIN